MRKVNCRLEGSNFVRRKSAVKSEFNERAFLMRARLSKENESPEMDDSLFYTEQVALAICQVLKLRELNMAWKLDPVILVSLANFEYLFPS